jgi:hypothetical protein
MLHPLTPDDVTILWDGRRLDSREAVMEWLAEVETKRAEEAAAGGDDARRSPARPRMVAPPASFELARTV